MSQKTVPIHMIMAARSLSLLFAGSAFYIGFVDPSVRDTMQNPRDNLKLWAKMYGISLPIMGGLATVASLIGGYISLQTRITNLMIGTGLIFSILPFTLIGMMPINHELNAINQKSGKILPDEGLAIRKLKSWLNRHRVRVLLSLCASVFFYFGEIDYLKK